MKVKEFEWDEGNTVHMELKHGVTPEEAEEVFAASPLYRKTKRGHYTALGPTVDGRFLVVVFEMKKGGIARVITGWDMGGREKSYWKKHFDK